MIFLIILVVSFMNCVQSEISAPGFSSQEQSALSQFRALMGDSLYKDYMKDDNYLIRWIRDQNLDLDRAKQKLEKALRWRQENAIDSITTEVMRNMTQRFPYDLDGKDYDGRPILLIPYSKWDIRKWMVQVGAIGRTHLARYNDQLLERGAERIRKSKHPKTGQQVTQAIVLIDLNSYNQRQHGCAACLPFYYDLLTHYEMYYCQLVKNFIFINTPKIFETVARYILTFISPATKDIIKIFDHDKSEWDPELKRRIPSSELPPQFGGTKLKTKPSKLTA